MVTIIDNIKTITNALASLVLYRNILDDPVVGAYTEHLATISNPPGMVHPALTYARVYHLLAETVNPMAGADAWQNHLLDLILNDSNPFSEAAFTPGGRHADLMSGVKRDLTILRLAYETGAARIQDATERDLSNHLPLPGNLGQLPLWTALSASPNTALADGFYARRSALKKQLAATGDWAELADTLAEYYAQYGCGVLGNYTAFKWQNGTLTGIHRPDPVTLSELVGYQEIRGEIIRNTIQFLHGHPANNILLYGDRGTGKSSTVKALLNEYRERGLRLVEVPKQSLADFPNITARLRHRNHRYIIFVDDLSFEENETEYKDFKALLEGGLEARPHNVLVYATSNRRHLVRETFADREKSSPGNEVRVMDSVQEKLSLADRFGITVIFPTPDQELFLDIVAGLAEQRKLPIAAEELRRRALHWSSWHNGRSPRAARQFIDQIEGQLAMGEL